MRLEPPSRGGPFLQYTLLMPPRVRPLALWLLFFLLLAAAINIAFAATRVRGFHGGPTTINVIGPEAAPYGWPATSPHDHPWPAPRQWSEYHPGFGETWRLAWGVDATTNTTSHQMQVGLFGWPLASLESVTYFWPQNDPAWSTSAEQSPPLRLRWSGIILNPLIFGGGLWLLLIAMPMAFAALRSRRRLRRGQCPACAYDLRGDHASGCPECGWNRTDHAGEIGTLGAQAHPTSHSESASPNP
jgi:hypothetical protein